MKIIPLLFLLVGCVPFVEYEHLDETPFEPGSKDAYDLVCGGIEVRKDRISASGAFCENVASNGGQFLSAKIRYTLE